MESERIGTRSAAFSELPIALVMQIDELADEFETAWRAGKSPELESFVNQLGESGQSARDACEAHLRRLQAELELSVNTLDPMPASNAAPQLVPPTDFPIALGEYRLVEQLGSGGMGVVYKAVHNRLDCHVAIKFPRFVAVLDRQAAARFVREAKLIGRLTHPNIVRALDAGESSYGPYLVTEFIDGETIEALVRRGGRLPVETAVDLASQAARALAYAHSRDVVHRDIKPSNLIVDGEGTVRVVDFGLAKLLADDGLASDASPSADRTECGMFVGTVGYAAPEQLHPGESVDHRADIYALGCALYYMLLGEPPHKGTLAERATSERNRKSNSERLGRVDVPRQFERVWQRMVAVSPQRRYSSMVEVERALQMALAERNVVRRSPRISRRVWAASIVCMLAGLFAAAAAWNWGDSRSIEQQRPTGGRPPAAVAPFTAAEAADFQKRWAEYLGKPVRVINKIGMPLVLIPPGEYLMGLSDAPIPEPAPPADDWRFREPEVYVKNNCHGIGWCLVNPSIAARQR